ncbi:hypothetical protein SO802_028559 [Lithocarpus litseifolius]|uniref:Uncharacterized protein n=1 Tax=Lithocarpus litseifolius TaxID=425828 RepID=A0AAW2BW25_9ROSI
MFLQFLNHLISSSPSNSYRQTAQLSGASTSTMSWTFVTGKNSRIRCLEKEVWESEKMRFGKKTRFLMKPKRESAWKKSASTLSMSHKHHQQSQHNSTRFEAYNRLQAAAVAFREKVPIPEIVALGGQLADPSFSR